MNNVSDGTQHLPRVWHRRFVEREEDLALPPPPIFLIFWFQSDTVNLLRIQLKTLGLNIKILEAFSFQQSAFSGGGRRWTSDVRLQTLIEVSHGQQSIGQHLIPLRSVKEDRVDFERASWPGGARRYYGKVNGARWRAPWMDVCPSILSPECIGVSVRCVVLEGDKAVHDVICPPGAPGFNRITRWRSSVLPWVAPGTEATRTRRTEPAQAVATSRSC